MRFFLKTEFTENGTTIDLITIAIVTEDGREYYAINSELNPAKVNNWEKLYVLPRLPSIPVGMKFGTFLGNAANFLTPGEYWRPRRIDLSDPSVSPGEKELAQAWKTKAQIRDEVADLLGFRREVVHQRRYGIMGLWDALTDSRRVEFDLRSSVDSLEAWGAWSEYDWVAFCQLFGRISDLPDGMPLRCNDVIQWMEQVDLMDLQRSDASPERWKTRHALAIACWCKEMWESLTTLTVTDEPGASLPRGHWLNSMRGNSR